MVLGRILYIQLFACHLDQIAVTFKGLSPLLWNSGISYLMLTKFYHRFKFRLSLCVYFSCLGPSL